MADKEQAPKKPRADYKHMCEITPQIKPKSEQNRERFIRQILEMQDVNAQDAGTVSYTSPIFVLATMPHAEPKDADGKKVSVFSRTNGNYNLTIEGASNIGVPYGAFPRLILVWLISEAVKTQNKEVFLGNSLSAFMRELGIQPSSGGNGSVKRIRDQLTRLFSCRITCIGYKVGAKHRNENVVSFYQVAPIQKALLWWQPKEKIPEQPGLFNSSVVLSEEFFKEIIETPVPLDMRALKALKSSSMALDIYSWLTYSMYSLRSDVTVTWEKLYAQFGADYARLADFKVKFKKQLADVLLVYNKVNIMPVKDGIELRPSPTHVRIAGKREQQKLPTRERE